VPQKTVAARHKRTRLALDQDRATLHGAYDVISGLVCSLEGLLSSVHHERAACLAMGEQLASAKLSHVLSAPDS